MKMHTQLIIALIIGIIAGLIAHPYAQNTHGILLWIDQNILTVIGQVFLRLIFMVVVPLVFCALTLGVYELSQTAGFGKVAQKTLIFTLIASSASVAIGILLVTLIHPGNAFQGNIIPSSFSNNSSLTDLQNKVTQIKSFSQIFVELIPKNPLDSAVRALDGEMIAFMVFALFFGFALSRLEKNKQPKTLLAVLEDVFNGCMKIIHFAMYLAPIAVFGMIFHTTFTQGASILISLGLYVLTVITGLLIQQFIVYSALLKTFTNWNPFTFFAKCKEVYLYAFSTASSNVTLPKSLYTAEHELGLSEKISRFVLTIGASANQNGTALFEGITVLFLAQVYHIDLSVAQQIQVILMSILAGVGTAGVPGGSLPLIMIVLQSVGIPPESIGLILGVDRFLDMCRTTLNVSGDLVIAALVEGKK